MPPRVRPPSSRPKTLLRCSHEPILLPKCQHATAAASFATRPAPLTAQITTPIYPSSRYSAVQPPSHRRPELRRSQLLRSYVSLLQTHPLILLFQHNNLKAAEWAAIRRELSISMQKLDRSVLASDHDGSTRARAIGSAVKLQIIQTNIFEPALRITEYYRPPAPPPPTTPRHRSENEDPHLLTHVLSEAAYSAVLKKKGRHPLSPLMTGSLALLTLPTVSPQYLKAALQILAPQPPAFPAPTRRANPAYWDPAVQDGLKKLMLLGARIDGKVFDMEGARWVGGIDGGIDGLRAQLVYMLQGVGAGITGALEGAARSLYFTMESRRQMLDEEAKPTDAVGDEAK